MEQQSVSATYLGTIKVSRGRSGNHVYPTLRLSESLGDIIGKRVGVYAVGDQVIISPDKCDHQDKNSEKHDSEKKCAPCL